MADDVVKDGETLEVHSKHDLYVYSRQQLMLDYHEAIKEYRTAKNRILGIRFAIRGLSQVLGMPVPTEGEFGPILPEDREHQQNRPNVVQRSGPIIPGPGGGQRRHAMHTPDTSNIEARVKAHAALSQDDKGPQGNNDPKV